MEKILPDPRIPRPASAWYRDRLQQLKDYSEAMKNGAKFPGISTGLKKLDNHIGGLQQGLHLLLASPGKGKTRFALNVARKAAIDGFPVVFITADEGASILTGRLFCLDTNTRLSDLQMGRVTESFTKYVSDLPAWNNNIYFQEVNKLDIESTGKLLKERIEKKQSRMGLVVVDYIQAIASTMQRNEIRLAVGELAQQIRNVAKDCKSPALVISSVGRKHYDNPDISSGKESGDLEFSADTVMSLKQPDKGSTDVTLKIDKNRWGEKDKENSLYG